MKYFIFTLLIAGIAASPLYTAQPAKVRISFPAAATRSLAAQKGFFAEEGIDVELIQVTRALAPLRY